MCVKSRDFENKSALRRIPPKLGTSTGGVTLNTMVHHNPVTQAPVVPGRGSKNQKKKFENPFSIEESQLKYTKNSSETL
jgi:hypothetical protein